MNSSLGPNFHQHLVVSKTKQQITKDNNAKRLLHENRNNAEFEISKKCETKPIQSLKPTWEPIELNRYAAISIGWNRYAVISIELNRYAAI